jgi:ribosomal protein S18 acetylase RimI-like enzyme
VNTYLFPDRDRYPLVTGTARDVATLLKFLQVTYQELYPHQQDFQHLQSTVDRYFTHQTPLWFVLAEDAGSRVACMWVGIAIDQITGQRHPNVFLLYVEPAYRRQGIASALMQNLERWAKSQEYTQIGLQVFTTDRPAIALYEKLGYQKRSISMMRQL